MIHTDSRAKRFSASSITTLEQCEQRFSYEYMDGYRPVAMGNGLKTGLMMHEAQEMYLKGHNLNAIINSVTDEVEQVNKWDEDELFLPKLRSYIRGYFERWEDEDADDFRDKRYEVLGVEQEFVHEVKGVQFIGKMDAVMHDRLNDTTVLMEHKNVSTKDCQDPTSIFWRSLIMNNQLTIYADYLAKQYNRPVVAWYDVMLTSPAMRPKIINRKTKERESLDAFEERMTELYISEGSDRYIRRTIPILDSLKNRRMGEILGIASVADGFHSGMVPYRNTQSCRNYGGCPFFECCIGIERAEESKKFEKKQKQ